MGRWSRPSGLRPGRRKVSGPGKIAMRGAEIGVGAATRDHRSALEGTDTNLVIGAGVGTGETAAITTAGALEGIAHMIVGVGVGIGTGRRGGAATVGAALRQGVTGGVGRPFAAGDDGSRLVMLPIRNCGCTAYGLLCVFSTGSQSVKDDRVRCLKQL